MPRRYPLRIYLLVLIAGLLWPAKVFPQFCLDYGDYLRPAWGMDTGNTNQTHGGFISGDYLLLAEGWDGMKVIELVDQSLPTIVGTIPLSGNCKTVAAAGDFAYVGSGSGWHIVDFSNPALPVLLETRDNGQEVEEIQTAGNRAYLLTEYGTLHILDVSDPSNPQDLGVISSSNGVDFFLDGLTVYLVTTGSIQIVDVTDPASPVELGTAPTAYMAFGVAKMGSLAFVAVGYLGMEIFDVSDPTNPTSLGVTATTDDASDVATDGETVFVACANFGVQAFEVTDPSDPAVHWSMDTKGGSENIFVHGEHLCILDAWGGFQILDISLPEAPETARKATPGALLGAAYHDQHCFVAEGDFGLQVFDVSDPAHPSSVQLIDTSSTVNGVLVADGVAYLANDWGSVSILDVSNPTAPVGLGWINTMHPQDLHLRDGFLFIADYDEGLRIVDVSDPTSPDQIGWADTPDWAYGVDVLGDFAYVAYNGSGILVIDVSDPASPGTVGLLDLQDFARGVAVADSIAYVAEYRLGLALVDVSVPDSPALLRRVDIPAPAVGVELDGTTAYVLCEAGGLALVDVSNPATARITGWFPSRGSTNGIAFSDDHVFIADGEGGLAVAAKPCLDPSPVPGDHELPVAVALDGVYPNPFNPRTTISFTLAETGPMSLRIFDLGGRLVRILAEGVWDAGENRVIWDGRNDAGRLVSSAPYIVRLRAGGTEENQKVMLVR